MDDAAVAVENSPDSVDSPLRGVSVRLGTVAIHTGPPALPATNAGNRQPPGR